jgi:hypothetical protein
LQPSNSVQSFGGKVPGSVTAVALKIRPGVVAGISGIAIGSLVAVGTLQRTSYPHWAAANLDSEISVATWFSAGLLWIAAFWWLLVAVNANPPSLALWFWWPILAWLALDEGNAFHERLERWAGIDWQLLYIPVMSVAAGTWALVVRRFRGERRIVELMIGGAAGWGVALILELVQNWGGAPVSAPIYNPAMIIEEALEMIGSTLVLVAAMLALGHVVELDGT